MIQSPLNSFSLTGSSDFLKERLFGLSNPQGNHGEGVKEAHFHLDNTPVSTALCVSQVHKADLFIDCKTAELFSAQVAVADQKNSTLT